MIDLSQLPSHGREVALFFRQSKSTRRVPIIFVDGESDKVSRIKALLPDATYATWRNIRGALKRARPLQHPVVPPSTMAGYSGTPLPKKLGIKPGARVVLVNGPRGFDQTLGPLPDGARIERRSTVKSPRKAGRLVPDLTMWFTRERGDLEGQLCMMREFAGEKPIWIAWPK